MSKNIPQCEGSIQNYYNGTFRSVISKKTIKKLELSRKKGTFYANTVAFLCCYQSFHLTLAITRAPASTRTNSLMHAKNGMLYFSV